METHAEQLLHAHIPGALQMPPYCKVCHVPFQGVRSVLPRLKGIRPDAVHPGFCNKCADVDFPPREQEVTVLFCDIRNYTSLTEKNTPSVMAGLLSRYFTNVSRVIIANEGIVEKFVGDAVMCFFNAPVPLAHHEAAAVTTGLQIRDALQALKVSGVEVGIGINSGVALVGKIGSEPGMDFGVVGDCVNVAARLQSQAKGGEIVLSRHVYERSRDVIPPGVSLKECELELKGKSVPLRCVIISM